MLDPKLKRRSGGGAFGLPVDGMAEIAFVAILAVLLGFQIGVGTKAFVGNVYATNANLAERHGEVGTAAWSREHALRWNPGDYATQYLAGSAQKGGGEYEAAATSFAHCLELAPNHIRAILELAELYAKAERFEESDRLIERAKELAPGYWRVDMCAGLRYGFAGDHESAALHFERALTNGGASSSYLIHQLSVAHLVLKNHSEAYRYAKSAISRDPDNPVHHLLLGKVFLASGSPDKAIGALGEAVALSTQNVGIRAEVDPDVLAESYAMTSEAYRLTRDIGRSAEALLLAVQTRPDSVSVGNVAQGLAERIRTLGRESFSDDEEYALAMFRFGKVLAIQNHGESAVIGLKSALAGTLNKNLRIECAMLLANILLALERSEEGLHVLETARDTVQPNVSFELALADALARNGRKAEARLQYMDIRSRFRLDPITAGEVESKLNALVE